MAMHTLRGLDRVDALQRDAARFVADGQSYFYQNLLADDGQHPPATWSGCKRSAQRCTAAATLAIFIQRRDDSACGICTPITTPNSTLQAGRTHRINPNSTKIRGRQWINIEVGSAASTPLCCGSRLASRLTINGEPSDQPLTLNVCGAGAARGQAGDQIELRLPMPVRAVSKATMLRKTLIGLRSARAALVPRRSRGSRRR